MKSVKTQEELTSLWSKKIQSRLMDLVLPYSGPTQFSDLLPPQTPRGKKYLLTPALRFQKETLLCNGVIKESFNERSGNVLELRDE